MACVLAEIAAGSTRVVTESGRVLLEPSSKRGVVQPQLQKRGIVLFEQFGAVGTVINNRRVIFEKKNLTLWLLIDIQNLLRSLTGTLFYMRNTGREEKEM